MNVLKKLRKFSLYIISARCMLSFNTYGRNFRSIYDTVGTSDVSRYDCDVEFCDDVPFRPGYAEPCCGDHGIDNVYMDSGTDDAADYR
ncbi:hypothetical protein BDAP_001575 [Binucleata daphniae]